jgi:hypothetical protein
MLIGNNPAVIRISNRYRLCLSAAINRRNRVKPDAERQKKPPSEDYIPCRRRILYIALE